MAVAAITIEGVLKQENSDTPISQGVKLYHALKEFNVLHLITDMPLFKAEHWLMISGLTEHNKIYVPEVGDPEDVAVRRTRQIGRVRAEGQVLDFLVDPNPAVAAEAMRQGIPTFLFCHPQYMRPSFRPDYQNSPRPWDEVESEIERVVILRQTDKRRFEE